MTANDRALLDLWLERHDGEDLDTYLTAMDVPMDVCGIPSLDDAVEELP